MSVSISPPRFTSGKGYKQYKTELLAWRQLTELSVEKQAIVVALSLPEENDTQIRQKVFDEISLDDLKSKNGIDIILELMDQHIATNNVTESLEMFEGLDELQRKEGESINEFISAFNNLYVQLKKKNMALFPEMLALELLKTAKITKEEKLLVLTEMNFEKRDTLYIEAMDVETDHHEGSDASFSGGREDVAEFTSVFNSSDLARSDDQHNWEYSSRRRDENMRCADGLEDYRYANDDSVSIVACDQEKILSECNTGELNVAYIVCDKMNSGSSSNDIGQACSWTDKVCRCCGNYQCSVTSVILANKDDCIESVPEVVCAKDEIDCGCGTDGQSREAMFTEVSLRNKTEDDGDDKSGGSSSDIFGGSRCGSGDGGECEDRNYRTDGKTSRSCKGGNRQHGGIVCGHETAYKADYQITCGTDQVGGKGDIAMMDSNPSCSDFHKSEIVCRRCDQQVPKPSKDGRRYRSKTCSVWSADHSRSRSYCHEERGVCRGKTGGNSIRFHSNRTSICGGHSSGWFAYNGCVSKDRSLNRKHRCRQKTERYGRGM